MFRQIPGMSPLMEIETTQPLGWESSPFASWCTHDNLKIPNPLVAPPSRPSQDSSGYIGIDVLNNHRDPRILPEKGLETEHRRDHIVC